MQLLALLQGAVEPAQAERNLEDRVREAIRNNVCTFSVTGRNYAHQGWYYCYTCGYVDSEGVCESCRNVCHAGHHVSDRIRESSFFCDCGGTASHGSCKCLPPAAPGGGGQR